MRAYAHDAHFRKGWGFPGRGFEGGFCKTSARCRRFEKKTSARCRRFEKKTSARCRRFEKKHPQDVDVLKKKHPQDVYFSENVRKMRTFQKTYARCGLFRKRTQDADFSENVRKMCTFQKWAVSQKRLTVEQKGHHFHHPFNNPTHP